MGLPRIVRVFGAVDVGSFRISAMIMGLSETGEMIVLGSGNRASQGIKRGYVTDMAAATYAIRDAVERAEKNAGTSISSVWVGCSGAGLASRVAKVEIEIGGRRVEEDDVEHLLVAARDSIQPDGRMVLHAQPAHYTLDGAHGVANPRGLHAERLGVDIHVMLADGAPVRNLIEAVQKAHLEVEAVVATPLASGQSCLTPEERELGTALIEIGGEVTNVALYAGGMLLGLSAIQFGSSDITDAVASAFGIRRFQAQRLKSRYGSAIASPSDYKDMIPVHGPDEDEATATPARGADDKNRIPRAELVSVITEQLGRLATEVNRALKDMGFAGTKGGQIVVTGGGAELAGIAEYLQSALGHPVRVGKPPALRGLGEATATASFGTLTGLCLYAAADPVDIRAIGPSYQPTTSYSGMAIVTRVLRAVREYF
ncbi:cell division protein FtsA [Tsuneonella mangrovi]|uniref:cell division protein FtsA n=1 Tax=Tsuneonella mangrovi TaxID=1982042 RepID=UPI000BA23DBC|nr:cell division protein FtsA [Tsuneonella mangrovi]